jgi:hypothetical protein
MASPNIVSGGISTMADLGKDEAWLQDWLKDQPTRMGLGELHVADADADMDGDTTAFLATDDDRYFSVDVRLGEMDASAGFQLLDNWARSRVHDPEKTHVAVLVTETAGDRYRTTLEALAEHLPLVVIELQVWRGENEAILVPHISLSSEDVDLSDTPAARAAEAAKAVAMPAPAVEEPPVEVVAEVESEPEPETVDDDAAYGAEAVAAVEASSDRSESAPENKDDTGIADPWGLPAGESDEPKGNSRLLSKIGG